MKDAAIGVRMHSGWGALIVVNEEASHIGVLDRRRLVITDPRTPGANQPYHFAARADSSGPEEYLRHCAEISENLALAGVRNVAEELLGRHYRITAVAVLLGSGRTLPTLPRILASHPLIHTAEGVFFRNAVWAACERLKLPVTGIRERNLTEQTWSVFGKSTPQLLRRIAGFKSYLGAPWTGDQKKACLAASLVLRSKPNAVNETSEPLPTPS